MPGFKKNNDFANDVNINGYVFNHTLKTWTNKPTDQWHPGETSIVGTINVAVDDDAMTIVPVRFRVYETRKDFKTGSVVQNESFNTLKQVMEGKTYEVCGCDAVKLRITGTITSNDFYSTRTDEVVSSQQIEGRFLHIDANAKSGCTFSVKTVLIGAKESDDGDKVTVRGYAFNYSGSKVYPVMFDVFDEGGVKFILDQNITSGEPATAEVWGHIVSTAIEQPMDDDEANVVSGFGVRPKVRSTNVRTVRTWVVDGADFDGMPQFGEQAPFTRDDMKRLVLERNESLERVKQRGQAKAANAGQFRAPGASAGYATSRTQVTSVPVYGAGTGVYNDIDF